MTTTNTAVSTGSLIEVGIYQYLQAKGYKESLKKFLKEASKIADDLDNLPLVTLTVNQQKEKIKEIKENSKKKEVKKVEEKEEEREDKEDWKSSKKLKVDAKVEEKKHFQRVDPSKVEFLDERLRTNEYLESKPSSYGDKAYAALAPTKGADFRKEKNKKKKGTYKGGQINTSVVHSIKFSNSSDDE